MKRNWKIRAEKIIYLHENFRMPFCYIGEYMGISAVRARQIYLKGKRKGIETLFSGLSVRSQNALRNMGCNSMDEIRVLFKTVFRWGYSPGKIKNFGKKSYYEVICWIKAETLKRNEEEVEFSRIMAL